MQGAGRRTHPGSPRSRPGPKAGAKPLGPRGCPENTLIRVTDLAVQVQTRSFSSGAARGGDVGGVPSLSALEQRLRRLNAQLRGCHEGWTFPEPFPVRDGCVGEGLHRLGSRGHRRGDATPGVGAGLASWGLELLCDQPHRAAGGPTRETPEATWAAGPQPVQLPHPRARRRVNLLGPCRALGHP